MLIYHLKLSCVCVLTVQSCPALCDPVDCNPSGSLSTGILQARILEWVAIPFSRGSSQPRDQTQVSCIADRFFTLWAIREASNCHVYPENCLELSPHSGNLWAKRDKERKGGFPSERGKKLRELPLAQEGGSFFRLVPSRVGQDVAWDGKRKMPGEDEVKETEDRENESTAEPPFLKPKKMGHFSPSWVTQARGISPWLLGNERHREGGGTGTEGKWGVFPADAPDGQPSVRTRPAGRVSGPCRGWGNAGLATPAHPHRGVR